MGDPDYLHVDWENATLWCDAQTNFLHTITDCHLGGRGNLSSHPQRGKKKKKRLTLLLNTQILLQNDEIEVAQAVTTAYQN